MPEKINPCYFCGSTETELLGTGNVRYVGCPVCSAESPIGSNPAEAIRLHNNPKYMEVRDAT